MEQGHWEVKDCEGEWHIVSSFQAAAYRLDGVEVRFVKE